MLKKTVTYTDFNGVEVTEDLYFHLSAPEVTRLNAKYGGDVGEYVSEVSMELNQEKMVAFLEDLILSSYGVKSDDGKQFKKGAKIREDFEYSQAYAEIFVSILTEEGEAESFAESLGKSAAMDDDRSKIIEMRNRRNKPQRPRRHEEDSYE